MEVRFLPLVKSHSWYLLATDHCYRVNEYDTAIVGAHHFTRGHAPSTPGDQLTYTAPTARARDLRGLAPVTLGDWLL